MSWPDRKEEAGAIHHVTSRGVNRTDVFVDTRSRERFLAALARTVADHRWLCHAYVLMDNHYHLLVQTLEPNLGAGMQVLNQTYAQWLNRYLPRRGHVFGERYRSVRIERQEHLLEAARYVVLNRVRAGACEAVADWPWSSYAATAGERRAPRFLTTEWLVGQLRSRERYRHFVAEGSPYASLDGLLAD